MATRRSASGGSDRGRAVAAGQGGAANRSGRAQSSRSVGDTRSASSSDAGRTAGSTPGPEGTDGSRVAGRFYESASRRVGERGGETNPQRGAGRDDYAEAGSGGYFGREYEHGGHGLGSEAERGDQQRGPRGLRESNDSSRERESDGRGWRGNGGQHRADTRSGGYDGERRGPGVGGMPRSGGVDDSRQRRGRWQREALRAREVMTKDVRTVTPDGSVREVAEIMKEENVGIVPVVDEQHRLVGLVTDRDIVIRTLAEGRDPTGVRAGEIMTDDIQGVTPDESLPDVTRLMGDKQIRRVPVVDRDDRLLGIISIGDVATRADYDEDLQDALEEISARRSFWSRIWS